jgi:hypothetical protein
MILFFPSQSHGGSLRVKPLDGSLDFILCVYVSLIFFNFFVLFCFVVFIFLFFSIELKLSCWIARGSCLHGALVEFLMPIAVAWEDRGGKDGMNE